MLEKEVEEDRGNEGEEESDGTLRALGALEFLNQDADPSGTTLVDARNGFNELSRLEMLRTVRKHWPEGAMFAFNLYRHSAQFLLRQPGELPVTILSQEAITRRDPLLMVLYVITLVPLAEGLILADPGILSPFYTDDTVFDGSTRQSAQLLKLLMKRGPDQGYFPEPDNSLFILYTPGQEEAAKREFAAEGLIFNFVSNSRYLGAYIGQWDHL